MKITFLGPIKAPPADVVRRVEAEFPGGTVRELLAGLEYPDDQVWFVTVLVNDERLAPDDRVAPDSDVTIMLVVGGG